jgi:multicomponent Na+:H+ antiporter subunit B
LLSVLCAGPIIYTGVGILAVLSGGNFLDYGALPLGFFIEAPSHIRAVGTLAIEVGVTLGVAGAVLLIFEALSSVDPEDDAPMEDA